jgi:hypothetical protein
MRLVQPDRLQELAEANGFQLIDERSVQADGGKQFAVQCFGAVIA